MNEDGAEVAKYNQNGDLYYQYGGDVRGVKFGYGESEDLERN